MFCTGLKTLATVVKHLDYNVEAIPNGEVNEKLWKN